MSFSLNNYKSRKKAPLATLKEIKKLKDKLKEVDLGLTSEEKLATFFKDILIINFITCLFLGLDLVKKVVDPKLTSWFDVYEQYCNPYRLSIELNIFFPIIQDVFQLRELYEKKEEDISKILKEISWAESAEKLSKEFIWNNDHEIPGITSCKRITLDIFEHVSVLLRNEEELNTVLKGTVYTPYYLAKQIAEKQILQWFNSEHDEKLENRSYHGLKILDPAVGTGVFLIAAGNVIYEKIQLELPAKSSTAIKKSIIENNLYGLDTDDIACYITRIKLMLWLISEKKGNFSNLMKFSCNITTGDSLVGYIQRPENFKHVEISKDRLSYTFQTNFQKKLAIYQLPSLTSFHEVIEVINQDFINFKMQCEFKFFIIEGTLENWNKYKDDLYNTFKGRIHFSIPERSLDTEIRLYAVFRDGFPDNKFINERKMNLYNFKDMFHWCGSCYPSKFDIIIGNPPFIALTGLPMKTRLMLKELFPQVYTGNNDLSYFFLERMTSLLEENGILGFILPKYLQTSVFAKKIRLSIVEKNLILELHDFGNIPIFSSTDVKTCFLSLKNKQTITNHEFTYYQYNKEKLTKVNLLKYPQSKLNPEKWIILHSELMQLLNHIRKYSNHKLKDVVMISKGIETGCDKVFAPKTPFFFSRHLNLESYYYRPWIKGKEIKTFFIEREGREVLYAPKSRQYEIENSQKILQYLEQNKKLLLNRSRVTRYYLWRDGDERNTMPWEKNKIVCPYKSKINTFAIDFEGSLSSKDVTWIVPKKNYATNDFLFYLLGLLNSNV
ncbi:MAG: Eco57I restriction-modification methylase domain-containing protein, partial [Candidatus Hodarchaeales archaeon]